MEDPPHDGVGLAVRLQGAEKGRSSSSSSYGGAGDSKSYPPRAAASAAVVVVLPIRMIWDPLSRPIPSYGVVASRIAKVPLR